MPDEATWRAIERAYCDTTETLASIAGRYGIAVSSIHKRAGAYGWPRRRSHSARVAVSSESLGAARDAVARQLYRRMSQRLEQMELGKAGGGEPSVDDPDDRMLTQLIRQFEKLTGLDGISQRERGDGRRGPATATERSGKDRSAGRGCERQLSPPLDAERIRDEIAQRLERLHAERDGKG